MSKFRTSITKRAMRRKLKDGSIVILDRYILNYKDPVMQQRKSQFFDTRKEAEAEQQRLYKAVAEGSPLDPSKAPTVADAVEYWLKSCEERVRPDTIKLYRMVARNYIVGPAFEGSKEEKHLFHTTGKVPEGKKLTPLLGKFRVSELTTAQIRIWHQTVMKLTTPYMAKAARKGLSTTLSMVGEDFGIRVPLMPRRLVSGHRKRQRLLLRADEVKAIFDHAKGDRYGLFYVFLFMTGARPSEMLGLLWEDVDFVDNVVRIRRNQEKDGSIKDFPKTAAGQRSIPMAPMLREALLAWKDICPRREGYPERVFPCLGYRYSDPSGQSRAGGALTLSNFRNRVWKPMLMALGLPPVTPYVARHLVISNLQAQGVEIGIVAKIAGHANPQITLQHYTHQVRDSTGVMDKLNTAYGL
ncbi:MAG TPA: site-specific integrase [Alphaproteobacteria bacterium]|nr:site-specific integrase [Alphaproteobacteria bacterium]